MSQLGGRNITISLIAERLSVSPGTVSSVLNGRARQRRIAERTAREITDLAQQLGYVPNGLARSLRRQSTGIIGVIFANHLQGWSQRVLDGMSPVFDAAGCVPFTVIHRWDPAREAQELRSLAQLRVDGILAIPLPGSEENYALARQRGIPLVFFGDMLETMPEANCVVWDSEQAAGLAVRQLLAGGRRRIGFIGAQHQTVMTRRRYEAYAAALTEAGLAVNPEWVVWLDLEADNRAVLERELRRMMRGGSDISGAPDAFFALNDNLALMSLDLLKRLEVNVPGEVALVGMGDLPETGYLGISLSTMREPCEELGRAAAELVLELINQPRPEPARQLLVANEFRARATSGH